MLSENGPAEKLAELLIWAAEENALESDFCMTLIKLNAAAPSWYDVGVQDGDITKTAALVHQTAEGTLGIFAVIESSSEEGITWCTENFIPGVCLGLEEADSIPNALENAYLAVDKELTKLKATGCKAVTTVFRLEGKQQFIDVADVGDLVGVLFRQGRAIFLTTSDSLKLMSGAGEVLRRGYIGFTGWTSMYPEALAVEPFLLLLTHGQQS